MSVPSAQDALPAVTFCCVTSKSCTRLRPRPPVLVIVVSPQPVSLLVRVVPERTASLEPTQLPLPLRLQMPQTPCDPEPTPLAISTQWLSVWPLPLPMPPWLVGLFMVIVDTPASLAFQSTPWILSMVACPLLWVNELCILASLSWKQEPLVTSTMLTLSGRPRCPSTSSISTPCSLGQPRQ